MRLDGLSIGHSQFDVPETPVVAWDPPFVGTPDLYRVLVRQHPTGATAGDLVAIILTKDTSLTIPPGLLVRAEPTRVAVQAQAGATRWSAPSGSPSPAIERSSPAPGSPSPPIGSASEGR